MFSLGHKTGLSFWVFVTNDLEQATSPEFPVTASLTLWNAVTTAHRLLKVVSQYKACFCPRSDHG